MTSPYSKGNIIKEEEMKTGIHDIPFKKYLELDGISCSYLKRLASVPAKAKIPTTETPAMALGTALHTYVLERDSFSTNIAVAPKVDRRTKAGKETWANFVAESEGKAVITAEDFEMVERMGLSIDRHPYASELLSEGKAEQSVLWVDDETGIKCKARIDFVTPDCLVDLKSTRNASEHGFLQSIVNFRYYIQAALYLSAMSIVSEEDYTDFLFIAVETESPFRVEVYSLSDEFIKYGYNEYKRLLRVEARCREDNFYPHYQNSGIIELEKPRYL